MKVIWGVGIRWSKESQRVGELGDNKDFQFGMSGGELYSEGNQFLLFRLESKFVILKHGVKTRSSNFWEIIEWQKRPRDLKAEDACEHLKLTSGMEEGAIKVPRYLALFSAGGSKRLGSGVEKKGSKGAITCNYNEIARQRETEMGREDERGINGIELNRGKGVDTWIHLCH